MKRLLWLVGVVFALLITACCPSELAVNHPIGPSYSKPLGHALVIIGDGFSKEMINNIRQGVGMWQSATNEAYTVEFAASDDWQALEDNVGRLDQNGRCIDVVVFEGLTSFDPRVQVMDARPESSGKTRGIGRHRPCGISNAWLVIDRIDDFRTLRLVASHEFGHTISLDHIDDRGSIMYKHIMDYTKPCLTKPDLIEFCDKFKCDVELMRYCEPTGFICKNL